MFHILSKLLLVFISPLTWVILLLLFSLLVKKIRLRKYLAAAALFILLIFSNRFLLDQFARFWDIKTLPDSKLKYSCAIILGGFASEGPEGQEGHFNGSSDRFIQALKILAQKRTATILISGGNASIFRKKFTEAGFVHSQLKQLHIPDSCVLIEDQSKNTLQNAAFSKKILETGKLPPPYLLVTSAFHMRRAVQIFRSAGLDVIPYPCDYKAGMTQTELADFVPDVQTFSLWGIYIKEVIGSLVVKISSS